jgi:hypothetical protein
MSKTNGQGMISDLLNYQRKLIPKGSGLSISNGFSEFPGEFTEHVGLLDKGYNPFFHIIPDPAVVIESYILMTASIFVGKLPCMIGLYH